MHMFILRMSTTLTSYICVGLGHLQITLWTLLTFTYRLHIRHALMHWNPCSIANKKLEILLFIFIDLISVDALNNQSDDLNTIYPPKAHMLAPYELEAAIKFLRTIKECIICYNQWSDEATYAWQHISIQHLHMFIPKLTISSSFNGFEETFWVSHP
jgi:hypothetical protein